MEIKKVYKYFILFVIGVILVINGFLTIIITKNGVSEVSDDYVIKRAKELGMIELNKAYKIYNEKNIRIDNNNE
ncbi:hypothetical protein [Helicovermis profundi]|uniref:Uncharacterized protein n=1 Tax=Helicovermis profundi TaxID=3065157 RepID=A0AAU9EPL4_9FIRM|nr:hypothetical protein HLPR_24200 [Clostridia bacterium S502]